MILHGKMIVEHTVVMDRRYSVQAKMRMEMMFG